MLKNIFLGFLPWILYFTLLGKAPSQLHFAITVAAITAIVLELKSLKKGFILSWGTLIFFVFLYIAVVILKNAWIAQHEWIFSNGMLSLIAFGSLAIQCPFTLQYAREQVPEEKWQHPVFIRINFILTTAWGFAFLLSLGLHIIRHYFPSEPAWLAETLSYLPSILAIWITSWFPNWYRQLQNNKTS
jgi:carotenoid cleavage dioxygenase